MAPDADDPGFLSRWSRRKVQVRERGSVDDAPRPLPAPPVEWPPSVASGPAARPAVAAPVAARHATAAGSSTDADASIALTQNTAVPADAAAPPSEPAPPVLTLADASALTRESDYTAFMVRGVQPDVRNAALGKLFTDPHFNLMDGLDVYIDDYGKPDPLPAGMLRQMLQAHVLGLFDDEDDDAEKAAAGAAAVDPALAAGPLPPDDAALSPQPEPTPDEDTDLQLQPDDDARRAGPAAGAGEDAGRPH